MCMPHRIPVQTIFEAHSDGCAAIAMSPDAKYIATISSTLPQVHNNLYTPCMISGIENSSLSLGKEALMFCSPGATSCFS